MSCAYLEGMLWLYKSQAQFCSLLDSNGKPLLKIDGIGHTAATHVTAVCNLFGMTSLALKVLQPVNVIATVVYSCKS